MVERLLCMQKAQGSIPCSSIFDKKQRSILGRVVKALDLSPSGLSPRGFEPRRMHFLILAIDFYTRKKKGRARVEPATYRAATDCSTTELTPHNKRFYRDLNPDYKDQNLGC
jgi:hypothetical protein